MKYLKHRYADHGNSKKAANPDDDAIANTLGQHGRDGVRHGGYNAIEMEKMQTTVRLKENDDTAGGCPGTSVYLFSRYVLTLGHKPDVERSDTLRALTSSDCNAGRSPRCEENDHNIGLETLRVRHGLLIPVWTITFA